MFGGQRGSQSRYQMMKPMMMRTWVMMRNHRDALYDMVGNGRRCFTQD